MILWGPLFIGKFGLTKHSTLWSDSITALLAISNVYHRKLSRYQLQMNQFNLRNIKFVTSIKVYVKFQISRQMKRFYRNFIQLHHIKIVFYRFISSKWCINYLIWFIVFLLILAWRGVCQAPLICQIFKQKNNFLKLHLDIYIQEYNYDLLIKSYFLISLQQNMARRLLETWMTLFGPRFNMRAAPR